ncbi:MAG: hypothetical protein BGO31_07980 [Bacteroidetes bacterium 43-16]|nr:MAG: hypothetical protein BGO31_07980 [Bacteroidetes bacterium 43-16]
MTSNNIWLLIQSMSPQEKRFFRRDYALYDKEKELPLYLALFDVINKQNDYEESDLLKQLQPRLKASNISYTKNYLYEQICAALLQQNQEQDWDVQIFRMLQLIRVFRKKGLYKQALKIWHKAIAQARALELFGLILQLKEEYRKLQLYHNPKITNPELQNEYNNNILYSSEFTNLIKLQELHFSALIIRRKTHFNLLPEDKEKVDTILQEPIMQDEPKTNSFLIRHYYRMTKATLLYVLNDTRSYQFAYQNVRAWQETMQHVIYDQDNYIEVLYIFYYSAVLAKDTSKIEKVMNHPVNQKVATESNFAYVETIKYLALNRLYNRNGNYEKVAEILAYIKTKFVQWSKHINVELARTLYLSVGVANFALEQFDDAFYYIKQSLLLFNDKTREEQYSFAYLFLLLICYEKGEQYLFEVQYKSSYAYFYRNKMPLPFEKNTIQSLAKAFNCTNKKDKKVIFLALLQSLQESQNDPVQQQVFNFFNVPRWLESKTKGIPYKELVYLQVSSEKNQGMAL